MKRKSMEDIRLLIDRAQLAWEKIKGEMQESNVYDIKSLYVEKDKLNNLIEKIRGELEVWLLTLNDSLSKRTVVRRLESLLVISEGLRKTYLFPGYQGSFNIVATIKLAEY